eukprot:471654-Prorocentrum_lima.AAC.1
MTSSLVGSEMCIRDSSIIVRRRIGDAAAHMGSVILVLDAHGYPPTPEAVSYTHLTLPTICSV